MNVDVENNQSSLPICPLAVQKIVHAVLRREDIQCDEVAIHFVDTPTICQMHAKFFSDPSSTDCISFPIDRTGIIGYLPLGDVFVCPETALLYAQQHSKTTPYKELTLYIIHGLLHLIGYDDISKDDRKLMKLAEKRHLEFLKRHGLWLQ